MCSETTEGETNDLIRKIFVLIVQSSSEGSEASVTL